MTKLIIKIKKKIHRHIYNEYLSHISAPTDITVGVMIYGIPV
jgi:hypothetical protein